jgi:hypothetical protein
MENLINKITTKISMKMDKSEAQTLGNRTSNDVNVAAGVGH